MAMALMVLIKPYLQKQVADQAWLVDGYVPPIALQCVHTAKSWTFNPPVVRALLSYKHKEGNMSHLEILDFSGDCILFTCLFYMMAAF